MSKGQKKPPIRLRLAEIGGAGLEPMDGVEGAFCPIRESSEKRYHDRGSVFVRVPGVDIDEVPNGTVVGYYLAHSKALLKMECARCGRPQLRLGCKVRFAQTNFYKITCRGCLKHLGADRLLRARQRLGLVPVEPPQDAPPPAPTPEAGPS